MLFENVPEFDCQPLSFNQHTFRENLKQLPSITVFKDALAGFTTHYGVLFKEGEDIRSLITGRAAFIDLLLHYAWYQYPWDEDICLLAVGGYGRGELHPHSDIDILILLDNLAAEKYNDQLRKFVTFLWDIGLEIGSSVRTVDECISIAKDDVTVVTNLMESRGLAGSESLRITLQKVTGPEHMWPMAAFFKAKYEEQKARHDKHNNTECNLEPNVKNAPGGLRDVQTINWIAKRYFDVKTLTQLHGSNFFTEHEFSILRSAEEFLWRVRFGIHIICGRPEERLLFEYQRELATLFEYADSEEGLAVEQFMQKYYRTVIALRELNDVLLQYLDARIHHTYRGTQPIPLNERFQLRANYIEVTHPRVFDDHPCALLEIFVLMGSRPTITGVRAQTIRLIREKRGLIDDTFRANPDNKKMFLDVFSIKYGLVTQLTRMKRYGILGRYLPEFGKITGQMQHDLFHRYTVDAHTLLLIRNLRHFGLAKAKENFPVAAHIVNHLRRKELLYIAGLFHDIAKGRGGDHSELGAVDAERFCLSHGLPGREARLVKWLVQKHLLMSYISQKRDIANPDVIRDFAIDVGDLRRLNFLYVLTVADMCATNPEIWNSWRASLMRQLYLETRRALRRGLENTVDKREIISETQSLALSRLAHKKVSKEKVREIWSDMGDEYFIRESHIDIANQTEALINHDNKKPLVLISETTNSDFEGATQIFVYAKNARHIFSAVCTCLAQLELIVQDAKIYHSATGYTLDTFYVLNKDDKPIGQCDLSYKKIYDALFDELSLVGEYSDISKRRTPRELKQFGIPTSTSISNDIIGGHTVLEVISPDRPAFLATIAHIFMEEDIIVQNARISTLGERVEDVFFVTDLAGQPLSDPVKCRELQSKIRRRLDRQVNKERNI